TALSDLPRPERSGFGAVKSVPAASESQEANLDLQIANDNQPTRVW
ncbi:hypothetical protein LCGC14_2343090, partial [marine sediment metagenome]